MTHRHGKSEITMLAVDFALKRGKKVVIATPDQSATAKKISKRMPGTLCEVVGDTFLRPVRKRKAG